MLILLQASVSSCSGPRWNASLECRAALLSLEPSIRQEVAHLTSSSVTSKTVRDCSCRRLPAAIWRRYKANSVPDRVGVIPNLTPSHDESDGKGGQETLQSNSRVVVAPASRHGAHASPAHGGQVVATRTRAPPRRLLPQHFLPSRNRDPPTVGALPGCRRTWVCVG